MITAQQPISIGEACEARCIHPESVRRARRALLPQAEYEGIASIFRALADSTRAKIVYSLLSQELCTCDLAAVAGISESAVSQHLAVLRRLRLVKSRREGKVIYHSLDDGHIAALLQVSLDHLRDPQGDAEGSLSFHPVLTTTKQNDD